MVKDTYTAVRIVLVNIILEGRETQLVSIFEVSVIFRVFLDCIICEMYEGVVNILKVDAIF